MNILDVMKEDKPFRRKGRGVYFTIVKCSNTINNLLQSLYIIMHVGMSTSVYRFSVEEILAEDWEIFEPKEKQ